MNEKSFLIFFIAISSFLLSSCNKETIPTCLTGTVRFTNISENPYDLYIEGEFKLRINGDDFEELDLLEGEHSGKVEQVSGYVFFPTIVEEDLSVFGCQETGWVFP